MKCSANSNVILAVAYTHCREVALHRKDIAKVEKIGGCPLLLPLLLPIIANLLREFGGGNDFWNLVPVERGSHQVRMNTFWRGFSGL